MSPGRQYGIALGLLVVAGATALGALSQVWVRATVGGADLPTLTEELTGRTLVPAAVGGAVLLLAGVAGIVATRGLGRRIVALLLLLAAVGMGVSAARFGLGLPESARGEAIAATGFDQVILVANAWWVAVALAALLAAGAALATLVRGQRWPVLGGRYERGPNAASERSATPSEMTPSQAWDALDRGEDPTTAAEVTE